MKAVSSSPPALPEAWAQVLDNVEQTLRRTEAAAAEQEQAIGSFSPSADADKEQWQESLQKLQQQMQAWPLVLQQAEQEAAEADAVLNAALEGFQQWLSEAEAQERRLAKQAEP
jgi:hypothetical protein